MKKFLKENRDWRVVFVMPADKAKNYELSLTEKLKDELGKQWFLESVKISDFINTIQRIFYFFYSYLVFTGTTKTLATMGMRPEDAPGAGRRILSPLKILIANTFGRLKFIKVRVVPYLYHKIFINNPFFSIFEKYQPIKIFAPNLFNRFDMEFLAEAKKRGIETVGMVTGWDHFDKYFLPFQVDTLLAQSEQIKGFATRYQAYNSSKVFVVGYPYFDFIVRNDYFKERNEVLKDLNFPLNSKYILYIAGSMYCPDEPDIIETLIKWADDNKFNQDVRLVIRPYPGGRGKDRAFDEDKFNSFKEHPRVSFQTGKFWGNLERTAHFLNVMRHADAVIAVYSTAVLEAAVFDKPLLTISFDGYNKRPFSRSVKRFELREHFKDVLKSGALKRAASFEELFNFLNDYLKNPELDKEKREVLRKELVCKLDGKTSDRVFSYLF
ncbi:MAG: hypothetical protein Athens101426_89 [Parcubacteria group bacterium Athens1014_26]|nr:MAG: hypothetical protein Athens101426_89 [Parcubacteria group bacterium Athens1014_26]